MIEPGLAEELPPVLGDATQLRQVIHNLLRNAEDALEGLGDARIQITTAPAGRFARLLISDNGPGFPVELLSRIFEPYVTTKARGTGLGLPIVKKIVEEHMGIIEIGNAPEGGARIDIRLPLVKEEEAKMAIILVVDDEVGIRELLSEILIDEGYDVRLAENAGAARRIRNELRPDLVLLDIWMPDMDGISLLKEWHAAGHLNMPVVMMSGHGTIDTAVEATRFGAFDFLEKPIALQKLLSAVQKHSSTTRRRLAHR